MNNLSRVAALIPDRTFVRLIANVHRRFEPEMKSVCASYPAGGTFIDVGAWYGPWTYWLSKKATKVVAFEPNPEVGDVLVNAVAEHVTVLRCAASATQGTANLSLPEGGRGTEGRASLGGLDDAARQIAVATQRIDDLDVEDVRLIKIDVEGHEIEALHGAAQLLEKHSPVLVVELEERHGGITPSVEFLRTLGYSGRVLVSGKWVELEKFDLIAHQINFPAADVTSGYLKMALSKSERYINNVVFVRDGLSSWAP